MLQSIIDFFNENQNVLQVLVLGLGATVFMLLYKLLTVLKYVGNVFLKFCTVTMELNNTNWYNYKLYQQFMAVLEKENPSLSNRVSPNESLSNNDIKRAKYNVSGSGFYFVKYRGKRLFVITDKEHTEFGEMSYTKIISFGRSKDILNKLSQEAMGIDSFSVPVKLPDDNGKWVTCNTLSKRGFETIAGDAKQKQSLIKNYEEFLQSEELYNKFGICWKNTLLLRGHPGTGKSSYVKAIASRFGLDMCVVDTSMISDKDFIIAVGELNQNSLLVLEDLDSNKNLHVRGVNKETTHEDELVKDGNGKIKDVKRVGVSLTTLLNVLDGVSTPKGLLTVISTNHPELLDPAVIRKGRVDLDIEIGEINGQMIETYISDNYGVKISISNPEVKVKGCLFSAIIVANKNDFEGVKTELEKLGYLLN